jgi:hypothetical protein
MKIVKHQLNAKASENGKTSSKMAKHQSNGKAPVKWHSTSKMKLIFIENCTILCFIL